MFGARRSALGASRYTPTMTLEALRTPCVLVDMDRVDRNLRRMQAAATSHGLRLRPHAKTHKSPDIARQQLSLGAVGICCAKLGEAEVFADAGIADIRLPYPLLPVNADRVVALLDRTRLSFIVDDLEVARGWSAALAAAGREVEVLVKVDVGLHRCGIDPMRADAVGMVAAVASLPGLRFRGLLSHAGHGYGAASEAEMEAVAAAEARTLTELAARLAAGGVTCDEISVGATPTARHSAGQQGLTEMRPGNYVFYDRTQVGLGAATWDDCALTVLARVVSRPTADRLVLDSGSKTLTNDAARGWMDCPGHGAVFVRPTDSEPEPRLVVERLSEEHAVVRVTERTPNLDALRPGAVVRIVPNHACPVTNLVDRLQVLRDGRVAGELAVAARGRIA
jgi:D-serine deaminase-like pyridoxal phosphate-dependent protein